MAAVSNRPTGGLFGGQQPTRRRLVRVVGARRLTAVGWTPPRVGPGPAAGWDAVEAVSTASSTMLSTSAIARPAGNDSCASGVPIERAGAGFNRAGTPTLRGVRPACGGVAVCCAVECRRGRSPMWLTSHAPPPGDNAALPTQQAPNIRSELHLAARHVLWRAAFCLCAVGLTCADRGSRTAFVAVPRLLEGAL